ncbi:conserved Plasmodium protein, unknown function [Plasmodium ovale curtisi]|uniref:Uncharacterized protein n=1 Tax=Plasmodium ovale curtisi TaxID=864141 RepID=A0A1A8VN49_PLAOA|nr:conserved Plasmodium protein, unknown function [Plasmodium ovale curtisi]SBS81075.1 conserved Plasmodium protein, unknown function [Plasmodium ovale curtisi]
MHSECWPSEETLPREKYPKQDEVEIYRCHKTYMGYLSLHFCVIHFGETIFLSVTDEKNELTDLQASYPIKYVTRNGERGMLKRVEGRQGGHMNISWSISTQKITSAGICYIPKISMNNLSPSILSSQLVFSPLHSQSDADNTVCMVGEPHSYGNDVARLLGSKNDASTEGVPGCACMKFKVPFYVSVNVDESDENLTNFIFASCLEMVKPLFKKKS